MKFNLKILPYMGINLLAFYLLPLFIKNTGMAMLTLVIFIPVICFIAALICGIKNGFMWYYALITALMFTPTIFIYYNTSAWIYIVSYGITALLGNCIGQLFNKETKQ